MEEGERATAPLGCGADSHGLRALRPAAFQTRQVPFKQSVRSMKLEGEGGPPNSLNGLGGHCTVCFIPAGQGFKSDES